MVTASILDGLTGPTLQGNKLVGYTNVQYNSKMQKIGGWGVSTCSQNAPDKSNQKELNKPEVEHIINFLEKDAPYHNSRGSHNSSRCHTK